MIKAFDVSNILLHIMLISAFLGSYFFTIGAYLEKEILSDQLNFLVHSTLEPIRILFPKLSDDLKNKVKQYNFKIDEKSDIVSAQKNKETIDKAIKFITIFFIVGLIIIFVLSKILDKEGLTTMQFFKKLIEHNLIILIFIALTELIFAFFFAKNYMSLDMNKLRKTIFISLDKIKKTEMPKITNTEKARAFYTEFESLI